MKLSERDKKLLLILAIVVIICLPYFFVIQPGWEKSESLSQEVLKLQEKVTYLEELAFNEEKYGREAEEMAMQEAELLNRFPSDLLQEANIMFIHNTEQLIPISLYQVAFGDDVAAQITSAAEEEAIDAVEQEMGDVTNDSVIEDNTQTTNVGGGLTGMQAQTTFSYDAGYEEFKSFLEYILTHHDRMVITSLDASYAGEMDIVNGSFTLAQYALKGEERNAVSFLEPNMLQGTTNIFKQATGVFGEKEEKTPDFFILLNQPEADVDAVIVGKSNDVTENTYLSSSKNAEQEMTVTFTGEEGNYNAHYRIGKDSYDKEGVDFTTEKNIELQIISSERLDDKDKVAISLNIVNETDKIVSVTTVSEDEDDPRVTIKGKTGDIIIH